MNELKPEDVMKALAWYEIVGKKIGSVTIPYDEMKAIADLLREKDAEIERLQDLLNETANYNEAWVKDNGDLRKSLKTARADAITEFVEMVKEKKINLGTIPVVCVESIDQIAEKLKGETDGKTDL